MSGVIQKASSIIRRVPRDLIRIYGFHDYHYITCSCYQRKPFMGSVRARDVFVEVFDKVRARYRFDVLNPVKRGLVENHEDWRWSSYRTYAFKERGPVKMDWYFPPYTLGKPRVRMLG